MKIKYILAFCIISLLLSCNKNNKINFEEKLEFDKKKSIELLSQIFEDEKDGYFSTNCIAEKALTTMSPVTSDFNNNVIYYLKIKDTSHYSFQYKQFKRFKLTEEIVLEKKIIRESRFDEPETNETDFFDWLDENCSFGYASLSKPIFNEDYSLAYVEINHICIGFCGGGEKRIYKFNGDKWEEVEIVGQWIS